ncbi:MAG: ATP-binding protein [Candidatus Kuenenbacteria bacterium]
MTKLIKRNLDFQNIQKLVNAFPITSIIGSRQCGKTFLAKQMRYNHYFDIENPRDAASLANAQLTLEGLKGLIIIDEIQRMPELFTLLRYLVDTNKQQKYLILGSASPYIIKGASESLAGRIAYYQLGGFNLVDVGEKNIKKMWLTGCYPKAFLAKNLQESFLWRENYITTFLERDIPQLGINVPAQTLRKFWLMLSHYHGQIINYSEFARSFGVSDITIRKYIDILEGTFMLRIIQPWHNNTKKRLVKQPKMYLRDSGIFHSLSNIETAKQLSVHNKLGASWEGFALECIAKSLGKRDQELFFWRTHTGAELDLFWQSKGKNWGIEFKYCDAPAITKSMQIAIKDLNLAHLWVIYPGNKKYLLDKKITVLSLAHIPIIWQY